MTKNNIYLPKESIPKTEEIRYLDNNNQPQNYEDFMKTYEPNGAVEVITEAEYQDRLLHGPQYGPGGEMSKESQETAKTAGKVFTGLGVAAVTIICPPAGIGLATGVAVGGATTFAVGASDNNQELMNEGLQYIGIGAGGALAGTQAGLSAHAKNGCPLPLTFCNK